MTPQPIPPAPPSNQAKPSGCSRGCLIALLVVGAVMAVIVVISGLVIWRAASSEEGKKVLAAMGKGVSLASKGINGPGAQEVREAGCPEAFVLDMADMRELIGIFVNDAGTKGLPETGPAVMVMCQGFGELPDCDELAKVYAPVKGRPPGEFAILVQTKHAKSPLCSRRYADDGTPLGDFAMDGKKPRKKKPDDQE